MNEKIGGALLWLGISIVTAPAAVTLANWNFDGSSISTIGTSPGNIGADSGVNASTSFATGLHASGSTKWTSPQGNSGSLYSFSADHWAVGDYFQFTTSAAGYKNLVISFEQTSSGTGPSAFKLAYSTDGNTFYDVAGGSYTVGSTSWGSSGTLKDTIVNMDLSANTTLNNANTVYFRLIDTSTTAAGGGVVGTSGTSRVDDFTISAVTVPELEESGLIASTILLVLCGRSLWRQKSHQRVAP